MAFLSLLPRLVTWAFFYYIFMRKEPIQEVFLTTEQKYSIIEMRLFFLKNLRFYENFAYSEKLAVLGKEGVYNARASDST